MFLARLTGLQVLWLQVVCDLLPKSDNLVKVGIKEWLTFCLMWQGNYFTALFAGNERAKTIAQSLQWKGSTVYSEKLVQRTKKLGTCILNEENPDQRSGVGLKCVNLEIHRQIFQFKRQNRVATLLRWLSKSWLQSEALQQLKGRCCVLLHDGLRWRNRWLRSIWLPLWEDGVNHVVS